jgi:hypothetical protein
MEFFLFDVILNRAVKLADTDGVADPDKVVKALAYNDNDIDQRLDRKYRSAIAFLPGAGVFYCARERRKSNCVDTSRNSLIPLDMSWLRITRADDNSLKFGEDGYVRYFAGRCPTLPVSGWRVTAGRGATTSAPYIGQFSVPTTMVHGCPQIWSTFTTSLVGLQLIGRVSTIGGWRIQTPRELGEGTMLPAAFTPHACQAIVL